MRCGDRTFEIGRRTYVMGVVNVTPDSFSDGGHFLSAEAAYAHGMHLLELGADVLDLGAESTRPGAVPVAASEELARLVPVIERFALAGVHALSVDTSKATVAAAALDLGAAWVNDVTGLGDPEMAEVARRADALVLMHQRPMRADAPDDDVDYDDVVDEVGRHLAATAARAVEGGVDPARLVLDPGIGFGKTVVHNLTLLDRVAELRALGHPVLVGPSRKRFLSVVTGADSLDERDAATLGACCAAALRGADLVRVHRVEGVRAALAAVDAIRDHHRPTHPPQ